MNAPDFFARLIAGWALTSVAYDLLAACLLQRWQRERRACLRAEETLAPVTFFRPLKAGVPDLQAKLELLVRALEPGDQLLIGAAAESAEWMLARTLAEKFPAQEIVVIACEPNAALNPKIAKLLQMEPHARHAAWILSDSEAVTDAEFLAAFRAEWKHDDVLTAGYRFERIVTWPQRLDAAAVLLTLWPGLAVVRALGTVRFSLGACTGFRRDDLGAIGGWAAFADDLAEDNRIGAALAATGRKIHLSAQVVTLESDPLSWRDYWRHQRRVAVTYRAANPSGFAGSVLTHGITASLLLLVLRGDAGWAWMLFGLVFVSRWGTAHLAARALGSSPSWLGPTVVLAGVVETICWAFSWCTRTVWWGGKRWRVSRGGKLAAIAAPAKR